MAFPFTATRTLWTALGCGFAVILLLTSLRRQRVAAASVAFVTGLGPWWDGFILFGALYLGLAFWLVAGRQVADDGRGPRR